MFGKAHMISKKALWNRSRINVEISKKFILLQRQIFRVMKGGVECVICLIFKKIRMY